MAYRGEDLDLRTPQTWSAGAADVAGVGDPPSGLNGQRGMTRNGPFWVDDVVLACCNHAYDMALAHRAGEVRIEHLLHAMTRIDVAAEALETRGVRVAALRRESAAIIASEIPVALPKGQGSPHRSDEFADVLAAASRRASRRGSPANVDELIDVLFELRPAMATLQLLSRHMTRSYVRDMPDPPRYIAEMRYVPAPPDRYYMPQIDATRYSSEPERPVAATALPASATDQVQNSRIEVLEQMVRALSADLSKEREVFSGLLNSVSKTAQAGRDDQGRIHANLSERLGSIESIMANSQGGSPELGEQHAVWFADRVRSAVDLSPLINRLDIIEEAVLSREQGDATATAGRLEAFELELGRALGQSSRAAERIEAVVKLLEARPASGDGVSAGKFDALMRILETQQSVLSDLMRKLDERMGTVEDAIGAEIQTAAAKHKAYANDLSEVHDALMKLNQNQHTLAGSIDQWRADAAKDSADMSNRIASLDKDVGFPTERLTLMGEQVENLNQFVVERYHRRKRFWYWLFGTDDWLGRSWPSQVNAIEAEKKQMQENAEQEAREALAEMRT